MKKYSLHSYKKLIVNTYGLFSIFPLLKETLNFFVIERLIHLVKIN